MIVLIFTSCAYLLTVIFLITNGFAPSHAFVGRDALEVFEEISVEKKVTTYIDQSARNAMHLAKKEIETEGLFSDTDCLQEEGRVSFFSPDSCVLDRAKLNDLYAMKVIHYLTPLLQTSLYTVDFNELDFQTLLADKSTTTSDDTTVTVTAKFPSARLTYEGKEVTYAINPSFEETITYPLQDYLTLYEAASKDLPCLLKHQASFAEACASPNGMDWQGKVVGEVLLVEALSDHDIAFSFAINLKTAQENSNQLF